MPQAVPEVTQSPTGRRHAEEGACSTAAVHRSHQPSAFAGSYKVVYVKMRAEPYLKRWLRSLASKAGCFSDRQSAAGECAGGRAGG